MPLYGTSPRKAKITGRTLHLYGPFDAGLAIEIFKIPKAERLAIRTLDLSDVDFLFADGALPVVAEMRLHSKKLRVRCEGRPHVAHILKFHGWREFLENGGSRPANAIPQRVQQFTSEAETYTFVSQSVKNVMQRVRCAKDVLKSFEWSLGEVIGNVFTHSESSIGALAQALIMPDSNSVRFSVVDAGVGLRTTLLRRYDVKDDLEAIRLAIQKGVTRDTEAGQGWGLYGTSKIASASGGFLSIWTGSGRMVIHSTGRTDFENVPFFEGTAIDFSLSTREQLSLQKAIDAVYDPISIVFNNYERNIGKAVVRLTEFGIAFSDRAIGRRLRNIVLNILIQPENHVCEVDFGNVRIVSSSFADEFIGKLARDLGPKFETRIRLNNVSDDNARIVSTAIVVRRARA